MATRIPTLIFASIQTKLLLISGNFANFAVADRIADRASRVRFLTEPAPGLGLSGAGCRDITL